MDLQALAAQFGGSVVQPGAAPAPAPAQQSQAPAWMANLSRQDQAKIQKDMYEEGRKRLAELQSSIADAGPVLDDLNEFGRLNRQNSAPIVDLSVKATPEMLQGLSTTAGQSGGLMGTIKPVGEAMAATQTAQGLLAPNEPTPAPPPVQTQPLDLSGVLNTNQQEQARQFEEDMRRRQSLSDFASYAMKGGR